MAGVPVFEGCRRNAWNFTISTFQLNFGRFASQELEVELSGIL